MDATRLPARVVQRAQEAVVAALEQEAALLLICILQHRGAAPAGVSPGGEAGGERGAGRPGRGHGGRGGVRAVRAAARSVADWVRQLQGLVGDYTVRRPYYYCDLVPRAGGAP